MSDYVFPNNQPVVLLECDEAFNCLTEKEKKYAHFLSRASWFGGLIVLLQTSPESPLIFVLLHKLFWRQYIPDMQKWALEKCGFDDDDFMALLVYTCGVFFNMGNFKGFGNTKFIPNLSREKFEKIIRASENYSLEPDKMEKLLNSCCDSIFALEPKGIHLGFPDAGVTTYFSKNCTSDDADHVKQFMKEKNIEAYNTRVFKKQEAGRTTYEIRLASIFTTNSGEDKDLLGEHSFNNMDYVITRGDYSKLLELVNKNLEEAMNFASNETEVEMLKNYIHSFRTGSLDAHKDGSRLLVKNKGPAIEMYIGFIGTHRDPSGMRGEFEGFVAMVNKKKSKKFMDLVDNAVELMRSLPWRYCYDKDTFIRPDFTSLDVLAFSGSGIPAGICIPNYDEIKQNEGFKNVSLGNVIPASYTETPANFLSPSDQEMFKIYQVDAFELQVGLHELLGHGSGKLLKKNKDGTFNFDPKTAAHAVYGNWMSPFSYYEEGETFESVFSSLGPSYEECRAECVGLYLCGEPQVLDIFDLGCEGKGTGHSVVYVNWLSMCLKGIEGLEMYDTKSGVWLQAHSQARFVILQVLLEAGQGFVHVEKVTGADGKPDLLLTVDRYKIEDVGQDSIGLFLRKLQAYKSSAEKDNAQALYDKYSAVKSDGPYPFLEYREIVMARKGPRKMFVHANTVMKDDKVVLKGQLPSPEGMIHSWMQRFENDGIDQIIVDLCEKDREHFV